MSVAGGVALSATGVSKHFGDLAALDAVDVEIAAGEVHAVLGENGAGKTTLMRVLAGLETPDAGVVRIGGTVVDRFDPRVALDLGVALVQQHFTLVPRFTAADNLELARPQGWRSPSRRRSVARIEALAERYGLPVRPDVPVAELSVGEQQRLELLRALDGDPRVLLLDEPTAVLTEDEADGLLAVCRSLADEGRAVVIISHRLREVVDGADRVTVLRGGRVVVAGAHTTGHDRASLTAAMVGAENPVAAVAEHTRELGEAVLTLDGVAHGRLAAIDLAVRRGEIVAVAGVDGNGQTELEAVVSGRTHPDHGEVRVLGEPLDGPRERVAAGVAYIAADRYRFGAVRAMSYGDNVELGRTTRWRARRAQREERAAVQLERWDVRGPRRGRVGQLSGGNAQKLVLARELAVEPSVVIACHPTRGLDPGAAATVAERVVAAAASGAAVLWVGSELDELVAVADRIVVVYAGRPAVEFERPFDRHRIGAAMAGLDGEVVGSGS